MTRLGDIDADVVRRFWESRSQQPSNRWTSAELLDWEIEQLRPLAVGAETILDLGSGHGELSRAVAPVGARLVAVDYAPAYAGSFIEPQHEFVEQGLDRFQTAERFDLILLFGVVTCTEVALEEQLYARIGKWLTDDGQLIVKHQCATGESFVHSGFSEDLGADYSGRYPNAAKQAELLRRFFADVEVHPYPARFNRWPDSVHVAFHCREPHAA